MRTNALEKVQARVLTSTNSFFPYK